jgi:acyl-CoA dehydrogenase
MGTLDATRPMVGALAIGIARAAWMADQRIPNSKEASMSKAYAGALVMKITATAVEFTAPGTNTERKQLIARWFRDAKVFDIFEGTAQVQRLVIARRLFPGLDIP